MNNYQLSPTEPNGQYSAIDLFCGTGGVTEGFANTNEIKIVAAINHSLAAIEAHKKNNPEVIHLIEDIRNVDVILPYLPKKINVLWASAECTNHSNAKGGQSRDADSRSLPEYLDDYVSWTDPDVFYVENVKEFLIWGPLKHKQNKKGEFMYKKNGEPIYHNDPAFKAKYYNRWVNKIKRLGYNYQYRLLNSADWGVSTSRTRYFGVFVKKSHSMAFPEPTHSKSPEKTGLLPWNPCRDKIDLENEGESIFARSLNMKVRKQNRKKLSDKSQARCAYGIKKFFLTDFISKNFNTKHNVSSLDEPLHNIDCKDRHMKIKLESQFLTHEQFTEKHVANLDEVSPTITTKARLKLKTLHFIGDTQRDIKRVASIDEPLHTILTDPHKNVNSIKFITQNIHGCLNATSIDQPAGVILTEDEKVIITLEENKFILKKYSGPTNVGNLNEPYHSVMTKPDDAIISIQTGQKFIQKKYSGKHQVGDLGQPYHVITTNPRDQITSLKFASKKQSKLHAKEKREFFFKYFPPDEAKLLDFLINDIKSRYLTSIELADITGFKKGTFLGKSEAIRKKHIGNAVPPKM